ncbi:MAG: hypothetical protein JSU63_07330, partial [Phycisphaerales bacterium]
MKRRTSVTRLILFSLLLPVAALAVIRGETGHKDVKKPDKERMSSASVRHAATLLNVPGEADPEIASWFGAIRSVSDTVVVSHGAATRGGRAVGDACGCDSECANLTSNGGCVIGQCVRQG